MTPSIWIVSLLFLGLSMLVSGILQSKFKKFSAVPLRSGLSGAEVAQEMLRSHGIYDVQVVSVQGFLSDHYDPTKKTVNLSPEVYHGVSVAAAAVAAHEVGHAVQHANAYTWLTMRSKLVPVVQFSSNIVQWVLLAGVLMINVFPSLLLVGIVLFAATTLFSVITLPVEFDASRRALAWLNKANITTSTEYPQAKEALTWAASTYAIAALSSIATLAQYAMLFLGNSRRED